MFICNRFALRPLSQLNHRQNFSWLAIDVLWPRLMFSKIEWLELETMWDREMMSDNAKNHASAEVWYALLVQWMQLKVLCYEDEGTGHGRKSCQ